MTNFKQCPQFSLIRLSGSDAISFINNQIINNFDAAAKLPHYSAICNAKGRILFSLILWLIDDDIIIAVDNSTADELMKYVNMRRFRMQLSCETEAELSVVLQPAEAKQLSALSLTAEAPSTKLSDSEFWQFFFQIHLPWITEPVSELFIPQHLSLDDHNLIEYQKGCYPGQEVIARLHFLGKIKKQLALVDIKQSESLTAGDKITLSDGSKAQLCSPVIVIADESKAQVVKSVT